MTPGQKKAIERATEQTDYNDHCGSLYTLAKAFGTKRHKDTFKAMGALRDALGHCPTELCILRTDATYQFYTYVEAKHGYDVKEQVRMAG